jgi:hypothetical protein
MHARWLRLTSVSILIACGGVSRTDRTDEGAGGAGAPGGSGSSATGGASASPCQAIMERYDETVKSAKICHPSIDRS